MLGPRHTWGALVCTWSCGVMCGISPLLEAEGDFEVAAALNDIWQEPRHRPFLMFYDRSCFRVKHLELHPDPLWGMTVMVTDRFLWKRDGDNEPVFRFNSARAESSNSILHAVEIVSWGLLFDVPGFLSRTWDFFPTRDDIADHMLWDIFLSTGSLETRASMHSSSRVSSAMPGFLSRTWDFFPTRDEIADHMRWDIFLSTGSLETRASMYSSSRVSSAVPLDRFGEVNARQATSSPSFVDTGKACVPVHFAGVSVFPPPSTDSCPAPVCTSQNDACAVAMIPPSCAADRAACVVAVIPPPVCAADPNACAVAVVPPPICAADPNACAVAVVAPPICAADRAACAVAVIPPPVCAAGPYACAVSLQTAPLDPRAVRKHMLEAEMGQAALVMLQKAGDLIRVAREWDHVEGMMVCVAEEQGTYGTYILRQMVSSRFEAFCESLEHLWEMASPSLGYVVRFFCRLSSFFNIAHFARFNDIHDSTFAEILERCMGRKGFADALLAGWVGLRWILVTADQRARDLRHIVRQYLKQPCPSKGYRLQRNESRIIAEVSRKLRSRKKGQRTTDILSLSRMLVITPRSLESTDLTPKIFADTIDRLEKFTVQEISGQLNFVGDLLDVCRRGAEGNLSKAIADTKASMLHEIHQQVRAAHNTVREECRAEMRQELAAAIEAMREEVKTEMRQELEAAETAQREATAMMNRIREERATDASRVKAAVATLAEKEKRGQEAILHELSKLIADSESRVRQEVEETIAKKRKPTQRGSRGGAGRRRALKGDGAGKGVKEERQDEDGGSSENDDSLPPPS
eukprot:g9480.t1